MTTSKTTESAQGFPEFLARVLLLAGLLLGLRILMAPLAVLPYELEFAPVSVLVAVTILWWGWSTWLAALLAIVAGDLWLDSFGLQTLFRLLGISVLAGTVPQCRAWPRWLGCGLAVLADATWNAYGMELRGVYPMYYPLLIQSAFGFAFLLLALLALPSTDQKHPQVRRSRILLWLIPLTAVLGYLLSRGGFDRELILRGWSSGILVDWLLAPFLLAQAVVLLRIERSSSADSRVLKNRSLSWGGVRKA